MQYFNIGMTRWFFILIFVACTVQGSLAQDVQFSISGEVLDSHRREPIVGATLTIEGSYLWAVTDREGSFTIDQIPNGEHQLSISYLGYISKTISVNIDNESQFVSIHLDQSTLKLDEIVVTAQSTKSDLNTSYTIGREALVHTQVTDITTIASLLPGGTTVNPDLTTERSFSLRSGDSSTGNAAFGTAVEVDGVRLSNGGSFESLDGVGTRNIAVDNIESIEVITGVPSVEYGDINSGVVKVKTRRGTSPLNVNFTVNPRTYQVSAAQGIALGDERGVINVSGEWARATSSLVSPYTSYTRRGLSMIYSNTFGSNLRFESGVSANIGGSNSEDDPDAFSGEYSTGRENSLRANISLEWLLNRSWLTNLKFDFSANLQDNSTHSHTYYSYASQQPAVHATQEGYFMASQLGYTFFADKYVESKEVNLAGAIKYELNHKIGEVRSSFKAGLQWKMIGNLGRGEYYGDMASAPSGFRSRDYSEYPYMHNFSLYAEERLVVPLGSMTLTTTPGLRIEQLMLEGSDYESTLSFSPRLNASLKVCDDLTIRGGWGVTEKLPSYYVLYPEQEYRDILSFGATYNNNEAFYSYYTQPYALESNPELKWQRNHNSEVAIDAKVAGTKISLTGFYNRTVGPYQYSSYYTPFSYNTYVLPTGYTMPTNPEIKIDSQSGDIYVRDLDAMDRGWTSMDVNVRNTTFTKTTYADNGSHVLRRGLELVVDFPQIEAVKTQIRLDAAYTNVSYMDDALVYNYQSGLSHTSQSGMSYQYVGIYATGNSSSSSTYNGSVTNKLNANITAVTHIPKARMIVSCRVEMSLLNRWRYKSEYNGVEYAFNSDEYGNPTGGSIYDGGSYTSIYPIKYMDSSGHIYDFTQEQADDPNFANLIRTSNNAYTFSDGGYDPYVSANLSVTKEIGDYVSLSFFANNFTYSRMAVTSYSTGISAIFVPNFYYGLTCRVKF